MALKSSIWLKMTNLLLVLLLAGFLLFPSVLVDAKTLPSSTPADETKSPEPAEEEKSDKTPAEQEKAYKEQLKLKQAEYGTAEKEVAGLKAASDKAQAALNQATDGAAAAGLDTDDPMLAPYQQAASDANQKFTAKQGELEKLGSEVKEINDKLKNVAGGGYDPSMNPKTLIPSTDLDQQQCFNVMYALQISDKHNLENLTKADLENLGIGKDQLSVTEVLGCAIKTGMVKMWMIPVFIKYIIDFLLSIAGLVAVGFVLVGGYLYMFGGLGNDKERGKKAILYGIAGFIVALLAWAVVNAVQMLVTS